MKIIICSIHAGENYKEATKYGLLSQIEYCRRHGYDYIDDDTISIDQLYNKERNMTWSKIPLIEKCLLLKDEDNNSKYDYVVWIDADIVIMNFDVVLEDLINRFMGDKNILICRDNGYLINTGMWFIKNDEKSLDYIKRVYDHPDVNNYLNQNEAEQGSLTQLYHENYNDLNNNMVVLHTSHQCYFNCSLCFFKFGYFLIHFLGIKELNSLGNIMKEYYLLPYPEETPIQAQRRIYDMKDRLRLSSFQRINNMKEEPKIAVVSLYIGEVYSEKTKYGRLSKMKYCEKMGYDYFDDEDVFDTTRHPAWSKIKIIQRYLAKKNDDQTNVYDYVVWMDADSLIMNDEKRLETFIETHMGSNTFVLSRDNGYRINTGVWFIKNNDYAMEIMDQVYANTTEGEMCYWEQGSFCHIYDNSEFLREKTTVLSTDNQHEFNCAFCFYTTGDFIVHFIVMRDLNQLSYHMNRMYIFKKDEESEEEHKHRLASLRQEFEICLFQRYPPE